MAKNKPGPKPRAGEPASEIIKLRATVAEKAALERLAIARGVTPSELVRSWVAAGDVEPATRGLRIAIEPLTPERRGAYASMQLTMRQCGEDLGEWNEGEDWPGGER